MSAICRNTECECMIGKNMHRINIKGFCLNGK
jgi:hypothetical protein